LTSPETIALVTRVVSKVTDRICGDRAQYPLLVCASVQKALELQGVGSRILYGQAAWIEVLEDHSVHWAGCWGEHFHFWVETEFREIVDLVVGVSHRVRGARKALYSPPMVFSREVPNFYLYAPQGIAELELTEARDREWLNRISEDLERNCKAVPKEPEFPDEALLINGRKLLDSPDGAFKHFDRALSIAGLPPAPF
jgi:hypothetical protein